MCTKESHAALKLSADAFFEGTRELGEAAGLRYRLCLDCATTLVLPTCERCGMVCVAADCIETPKGAFHFACVVARALEKGAAKFVAVVRVGTAKEMR